MSKIKMITIGNNVTFYTDTFLRAYRRNGISIIDYLFTFQCNYLALQKNGNKFYFWTDGGLVRDKQ